MKNENITPLSCDTVTAVSAEREVSAADEHMVKNKWNSNHFPCEMSLATDKVVKHMKIEYYPELLQMTFFARWDYLEVTASTILMAKMNKSMKNIEIVCWKII